jgi:dUTP pyrophosphatase
MITEGQKMEIKVNLLRDNANLPYKKHINDAGYDISWAPSNLSDLPDRWLNGQLTKHVLTIKPGQSVVLETGLRVLFDRGYVMEVKNRSGIASKKSLLVGAHIIDHTYRGEIFVNLHNVSDKEQYIQAGDRIAQFIVYKVENCVFESIDKNIYDNNTTERGDGGFGSTGLK